jgi:hypothetical protein
VLTPRGFGTQLDLSSFTPTLRSGKTGRKPAQDLGISQARGSATARPDVRVTFGSACFCPERARRESEREGKNGRAGRPFSRFSASASADGAVEGDLATTHFEAISRVHGLDVENFPPRETEHALDRSGHVFVHSVGKLDHDDGAFPRCAYQSTNDGARATAELAEHYLHSSHPSMALPAGHKLHNFDA